MFECFPNLVYFFLYLSISLNIQAYEQKTKIPPKKQSDIVKMAEIFEKIFDRISGKDNLITKKKLSFSTSEPFLQRKHSSHAGCCYV